MKHLKLFFALFAMLALGVGNAWGAEELKETITPKDNGSDSSTAFTTATALSNGFVSNAAINAVTEVSKVYPGNGGWKFGSSSAAGKISFTLKTPISNVTKIVITAKQYHATKKTTLNCNDIGAKTLTTSFADYEYEYTTPTEVSTISLVSAKASSGDFRCYVKEIKIYAETTSGGSTEPVVSLLPKFIHFWCSLFAG